METNLKTKWAICAAVAAIVLVVAIGCDTEGGSSGEDGGGGTTNKPVVVQVSFGVPVCSDAGQGTLNGAVFNGAGGYLYVTPVCSTTNATMIVLIKVVSSLPTSAVDHYIWTIKNWSTNSPNGIFTGYDELVDNTSGVFKVKTFANQIRYNSAAAADLLALANLFSQAIDVTVMSKDGQMASASISLFLHNGMPIGDSVVYGGLSTNDSVSTTFLTTIGRVADYFSFVGGGGTNVLNLTGDFDTFLAVYDTNKNLVAWNDDLSGARPDISQVAVVLSNNIPYVVEATSATNLNRGNYALRVDSGMLQPVLNPFVTGGSCDSIAGAYAVKETLAIDLTFNGTKYAFTNITVTGTVIEQTGCSFTYQVNDPTGLIPPLLRMGRLDYNRIDLFNDAYLPQTPEIEILQSSVTGNGVVFASGLQISSSGSFSGTFIGLPFTVRYTSVADFTK